MSVSSGKANFFEADSSRYRLAAIVIGSTLAIAPFVIWPRLLADLLASDFLPHAYCYLKDSALVWAHVIADSVITISYVAISVTLGYVVRKARTIIPLPWMLLAFGLFIVLCGLTHFMEVVTVWMPVYILSAAIKIFAAAASLATAIILPLTIPQVLTMMHTCAPF
jgi:hypothetical protein